MGNICCHMPEPEQAINTLENDNQETENSIKKDKYPHDSDSAFLAMKNKQKKIDIKPLSKEEIIEE